jgi:hypothetical protein
MSLGAFQLPFLPQLRTNVEGAIDSAIVTPAERVAQYSVLGALGGLGLAAVLGLSLELVPRKNRWGILGLLAVPAVGAAAGVYIGARSSQP